MIYVHFKQIACTARFYFEKPVTIYYPVFAENKNTPVLRIPNLNEYYK